MRRIQFCALMISLLLLLSACGAGGGEEEKENAALLLQQEYQSIPGCSMTARVRCDRDGEVEDYTLTCQWRSDDTATVTIVEPEYLAGVSAAFDGETMSLLYEDVSLGAGAVSSEELSPAQALPAVVRAIREGYLLEKGAETVGDAPCLHLVFDTTGENGGKINTHVWFGEDHLPVRSEIVVDNQTIFTVSFTSFSVETTQGDSADPAV